MERGREGSCGGGGGRKGEWREGGREAVGEREAEREEEEGGQLQGVLRSQRTLSPLQSTRTPELTCTLGPKEGAPRSP